jgi:hypothetical protein
MWCIELSTTLSAALHVSKAGEVVGNSSYFFISQYLSSESGAGRATETGRERPDEGISDQGFKTSPRFSNTGA